MPLMKRLMPKIKIPRSGLLTYLKRGYPLWGLGAFLAAFLLGFLLFFPLDPLASRLEGLVANRGGLTLSISNPGWGFPPGIMADTVSLTGPQLAGETILLHDLRLSPLWGSLFSSNPGVSANGRLFSGELDATARKRGNVTLSLTGARLVDQKLSPQLSLRLSGNQGVLHFDGVLPFAGNNQNQADFKLEQVELAGMTAIGSGKDILSAGTLLVEAESKGNNLSIKTLQLTGGDLEVTGSGTFTMNPRPELSRMNLSLDLKPGADMDPQLRDLLSLLNSPEPDGSIKVRLLGSLAAPQLR